MSAITHKRLLELLHYEPATGVFTWRVTRNKCKKQCSAGQRAGTQRADGYRLISVDRNLGGQKNYLESRLAWFYMTGKWPKYEIDHRDLDPSNNRWSNLREATRNQNQWNTAVRANNSTGFKGVRRAKQKVGYEAYFVKNGKHTTLGTYPTIEEAAAVRKIAAEAAFGEYVRHEL